MKEMGDTFSRKIEEHAARRAEKRKGESVWAVLFRSFFALLLACGGLGGIVILALRDNLTWILAAVLGGIVLLAGTFVSQTATAAFLSGIPELVSRIRGK